MTTNALSIIPLASPATVYLPPGGPRPRLVTSGPGTDPVVMAELHVCYHLNSETRTIHAEIARIPRWLLLHGREDYAHAAADTPAEHSERLLQILGSDPAGVLQALCDGTDLPPMPPRVPREIANWRARAVLEHAGLLATVDAMIAGMTGPESITVRNAWQSAAPLARSGPTVAALAPTLGLSDAQVDAMFIQAEALQV